MKILSTIAACALLASSLQSFATDVYHPAGSAEEGVVLRADHVRGLTRVAVEDDVLAAKRDGTLTNISRGYPPRYPLGSAPVSSKTRQEVTQEYHTWKMQPLGPDGKRTVPGVGFVDREAP